MMAASFVALIEVCLFISFFHCHLYTFLFIFFIWLFLFHIVFNFLQSTGGYIAVSRYASATPLPPSVLSRGIGWQVNIILQIESIFSRYICKFNSIDTFYYCRFRAWSRFVCRSNFHFSHHLWSSLITVCDVSGGRNSIVRDPWVREWIISFHVRFLFKISLWRWYDIIFSVGRYDSFKKHSWIFCRENAGLLALTRVGSRRVVQISAGFMIFFSILGKFMRLTILILFFSFIN
jgi:hypothetical protein